jgi:hypothetical protein
MNEVVAASRRSLAWSWTGGGLCAGPIIADLDAAPVLLVTAMSTALGLLTTAWHHWWWDRNAILATDQGLVVRSRGREVLAYRWSEIDRASWSDGFWGWSAAATWSSSACVLVAPHGAPHAVPGPNDPVRVGAVPSALPWRRRAARSHAVAVLRRHLGDRVNA